MLRAVDIPIYSLTDLLDSHLPRNKEIDFFSIDCEGLDLEVLRSNDFDKYRPKVIIVEIHAQRFQDVLDSEITKFLESKDYALYQRTNLSVFYLDNYAHI